MKRRTTVCLELTDSQLLHLTRLAAALEFNKEVTIKDLKFPKEFRNIFRDLFWHDPVDIKEPSLVEEEVFRGLRPTELMTFVVNFHKSKKIK
jgi:hypothetical protein